MAGLPESDPLSEAPETVRDLAISAARFVEKAVGAPLDCSQDTLPILDHYLAEASDVGDDVLALVVPACGAYFGEVVRRHLGEGVWQCPEEDYKSWRLELPSASISFNPIGVAMEVAAAEDADGWGAAFSVPPPDRAAARDAADVLGEVAEEVYYTFAVRFDVLVQVHSTLRRARANVSEP